MSCTGLRLELVTACADGHGLATVVRVRRHDLDAALAVLMVGPLQKGRHPQAGLLPCSECPVGVVRMGFVRSEQGFRIGVVIRPHHGPVLPLEFLFQPTDLPLILLVAFH